MGVYKKQRKDGTYAWFYDFSHNDVRYRGVGGTTKTQAIRTLEKMRTSVLNSENGLAEKLANPLLKDFAQVFLQRRRHIRSSDREEIVVNNLLKFFKGNKIKLMSITAANFQDYINHRIMEGAAHSTINREFRVFRRMFNLAIKWKDTNRNPINDVDFLEEPPGRTRFLSDEEAQRLIDYSADHMKPIIICALNTGMRLMEILTLKWDQVHIDNVIDAFVEIRETKNNKKRFIELNDDMIALFRALKGNNSEHVFLGSRGVPLKSVKRPFQTALQKAGIKDFKFHDLRHTFASWFLMAGGDLKSLQEILGHGSLRMVLRYSHLTKSHKKNLINNLNGKLNCHLYTTWDKKPKNRPKNKTP